MGQSGGFHLLSQLSSRHQNWPFLSDCEIQAADCLSVCDSPCAVAFSAPQKNIYLFAGLSPLQSAAALLKFAEQYIASPEGTVAQMEQPEALKRKLLARIPPVPANLG